MNLRGPGTALVVSAVFFGIAPTGTKFALGGFGPVTAMVVELLASTAVLWIMLLRRGYQPLRSRRRVLLLGLLEPGLAYLLYSFGLDLTTASNAALMTGLECGFVVVLAALFLHERAGWSVVAAALVAVLGLVVLEGGTTSGFGSPGLGDLMMAGGALSAALYTIVARGLPADEDPMAVTAHQFAVATAVVLPLAALRWGTGAERLPVGVPAQFWLAASVVGVLGFASGFLLYNSAITVVRAGPAAVVINLAPAFGLGSAVLWLGETLTVHRVLGATLIALSVGLFIAVERASPPAPAVAAVPSADEEPERLSSRPPSAVAAASPAPDSSRRSGPCWRRRRRCR